VAFSPLRILAVGDSYMSSRYFGAAFAELDGRGGAAGGRYVPFAGDVSVHAECRAAVATCVERFGAINVMCAHTGIADPLPLLDMTDEH
jgi:NAD(P)-dependent dehydrogenase (short-subunit alcohol dehydrogenase family)